MTAVTAVGIALSVGAIAFCGYLACRTDDRGLRIITGVLCLVNAVALVVNLAGVLP